MPTPRGVMHMCARRGNEPLVVSVGVRWAAVVRLRLRAQPLRSGLGNTGARNGGVSDTWRALGVTLPALRTCLLSRSSLH